MTITHHIIGSKQYGTYEIVDGAKIGDNATTLVRKKTVVIVYIKNWDGTRSPKIFNNEN